MYYYLSKEYAKNNGIWLFLESELPFKEYKETYGEDCVEFQGEAIPQSPWWDEKTQEITELPIEKAVEKGILILNQGEYIQDGYIQFMPVPDDCALPVWNKTDNNWEDSSNDEEKLEHLKKRIIKLSIELSPIRAAGFNDIALENKIKELTKEHMEFSHKIVESDGKII